MKRLVQNRKAMLAWDVFVAVLLLWSAVMLAYSMNRC